MPINSKKKFGILIGRFQPIHLAHQSIINEIIHDGLTPLLFIGSSNVINSKNPFSYIERSKIIHEIYGEKVITLPLPDSRYDFIWKHTLLQLLKNIGISSNNCCLYFFKKDNEFNVCASFKEIKHQEPTYHDIYGKISASKIRENPLKYKKFLDGSVLKYLINKKD